MNDSSNQSPSSSAGYTTGPIGKTLHYIQASYREITEKVTWPTAAQLQASATIVLVASLIISLLIGGVDALFKNVMQWIYQAF